MKIKVIKEFRDKFDKITIYKIDTVIEKSLLIKKQVVEEDGKETGLRKVLNFGHTYGHALETYTSYRKFTHGQAVVYGMMFAFDYALKTKMINQTYYNLAYDLFAKYGFKPIKPIKYDTQRLVQIMQHDKKASDGEILMILPDKKASVVEQNIIDIVLLEEEM